MLCLDVNVLVSAQRADLADNERYGQLLETWANGSEPVGVPDLVLSGFLRIVTSRRIFAEPTTSTEAWGYVDRLLDGHRSSAPIGDSHDSHDCSGGTHSTSELRVVSQPMATGR